MLNFFKVCPARKDVYFPRLSRFSFLVLSRNTRKSGMTCIALDALTSFDSPSSVLNRLLVTFAWI